jgi:serine/threonine protein kinase
MGEFAMNERTIFLEALEKTDPAERAAYLDWTCANNAPLRDHVEQLLGALDNAGSFMAAPPGHADSWADATRAPGGGSTVPTSESRPIAEGPGARIGPFKLLERIGEGGMGVVFMAEQDTPVRRTVALKIIKPGMDSSHVIARFEAERQALALMDHPNIARVFDAGTTETGRPYFVMELVKGAAITDYCDRNALSPRERLELFVPVCQAIQHAHQKGIIHRDIKPTNVLVTLYDGKPVPKMIDFGVAKAIDQSLTEMTLFTQFGQVVGTLEYMSPEQAGIGELDIDTRSDVYSLGVLLYELLTGSTPLEKTKLRQAAYAEIIRQIREEEPPKPSTRLSESRATLLSISAQRQTEPARLARLVRGELDWIVMKALEKDRNRRYETASGLARDVECHLAGDPVEAGRPSSLYRLRKLVRRQRARLLTVGSFAGLMVAVAAFGTVMAVEIARQRMIAELHARRAIEAEHLARLTAEKSRQATAEAGAVRDFVQNSLIPGPPGAASENDLRHPKVLSALDTAGSEIEKSFAGHPAQEASLRMTMGVACSNLGEPSKAVIQFERAFALRSQALGREHPDSLASMEDLARALNAVGALPKVESVRRQIVAVYETISPDAWVTFQGRSMLGENLLRQKKYADAEPLLLAGYQGMKARESKILVPYAQQLIREAAARLVALYDAWGKKDKAEEWRKKLDAPRVP